ncbi:MAG: alpha/beta hydrolase [Candidatus Melainabacteria bacterium]|jgi:acetyl esterase|nr:alpha/beta hydrolase [Candidatus Melainabacteria bacterium]
MSNVKVSAGIETTTREFLDKINASTGPALYELTAEEARKVFDGLQGDKVAKMAAQIEEKKIPGGPKGDINVHIARPQGAKETLPVILYIHGAGWVLGGWQSHDRLCLELANKANAVVVFVDYSLSPEAKYPVAIEESYVVAKWVFENAKEIDVDASRMAVAGDSVGGNMSIALTMMCKERGGPKLAFQCLFYPVTDADFDNGSYEQFGENHFLTREAMKWFWNNYADESQRNDPKVCPLKASAEQLKGLPPAIIFTAENDVLRDEGEGYAHNLTEAGVHVTAVRCLGTIHDFVMLHALAETPAARFATETGAAALKAALHREVALKR